LSNPFTTTHPEAGSLARLSVEGCLFPWFDANETRGPAWEIWTQFFATHIAIGHDPTIALESVANAHTAADLRVRPVSKTALV
jgi:hypothetical protein